MIKHRTAEVEDVDAAELLVEGNNEGKIKRLNQLKTEIKEIEEALIVAQREEFRVLSLDKQSLIEIQSYKNVL